MKTSFTVNGEVELNLHPENELHKALLKEMASESDKGRTYRITAANDGTFIFHLLNV